MCILIHKYYIMSLEIIFMLIKDFGDRVKDLRNVNSISQIELSKSSGIGREQISRIENGQSNVTLNTIGKLSKAFNISVKELMDFEVVSYKLKPFVKWAGGKTQILLKIKELMPDKYGTYLEPFVGGGALFLNIAPNRAIINDSNEELISVYKCFKSKKKFNELLNILRQHEQNHSDEYFYQVRNMDRLDTYKKLSIVEKAARMVYLNKACFNGLYRVNSKGFYNVPSGRKTKVNTFALDNMEHLYDYFSNNRISIFNADFERVALKAKEGDFVYFDPPYDTWEDKNSFTSYSKDAFGKEEQVRLANLYKRLDARGVKLMLSNHNTAFINKLYQGFNIHEIKAKRMINSKASGRGNVMEVLITNY